MAPARRWLRRAIYTAILLATVISYAPAISLVVAGLLAFAAGCRLDEGSVHPCVIAGADRGRLLYELFVLGWLMFATLPGMVLTAAIWLAILLRTLIRRVSKRSAGRSSV